MIALGAWYFLRAEEIETVEKINGTGRYAYSITVMTKSGHKVSVSWEKEDARDRALATLIRDIEWEQRNDYERLYSEVSALRNTVKTIDRRGLRIWRQLRDLLGVQSNTDLEG